MANLDAGLGGHIGADPGLIAVLRHGAQGTRAFLGQRG
jgi:hypothetical protein